MKDLDTIGRYETVGLLGRGGMGSVYLARDPLIDRQLAIKVLDSEFDEAARERFAREARAAGRLHHPNIVTIFDVGEHRGLPFIAMEYVPGQTLAALIRSGTLMLTEKLRLLEDACAGLAFAHRSGIVHLDVKPANLIRHDSGVLKVLDFGIARVATDATHTRQIAGTLRYMAPEQVLGHAVDRRTDVFAVGCVLYEAIAGEPAFKGTVPDLLSRVTSQLTAVPLAEIVPDVHPGLVRMTQRAMAHDPHDRYDDLEVLREELNTIRRELAEPVTTVTVPLPAAGPPVRRRRGRIGAAAGAAVAMAALAAMVVLRSPAENPNAGGVPANTPEIPPTSAAAGSAPPLVEAPPVERNDTGPPESSRGDGAGRAEKESRQVPARREPAPPENRNTEVRTTPEPSATADPAPAPPPAPLPPPRSENAVPEAQVRETSSPPAAAVPTAEASIADVLKAYEAAYDARDAAAVRRIVPALSDEQLAAISRTFADAISYDVDLKVVAINVSGATATAKCLVTHALVPKIGSASRSSPRETLFHLRQTSSGWAIDRIER